VFFAEVAPAPLRREPRLLDVGAELGTLAIVPYCRLAAGVDSEPEMVVAARVAAAQAGGRPRHRRESVAPTYQVTIFSDLVAPLSWSLIAAATFPVI
jgi:hypothetical protein